MVKLEKILREIQSGRISKRQLATKAGVARATILYIERTGRTTTQTLRKLQRGFEELNKERAA